MLLALARVNLELKNYEASKKGYDELKQINPALAEKYSYLGQGLETGNRAADVESQRLDALWIDFQ